MFLSVIRLCPVQATPCPLFPPLPYTHPSLILAFHLSIPTSVASVHFSSLSSQHLSLIPSPLNVCTRTDKKNGKRGRRRRKKEKGKEGEEENEEEKEEGEERQRQGKGEEEKGSREEQSLVE